MSHTIDLIAAMAFGLESVVVDELRALGYKSKTLANGRVLFRADLLALARANLWLRTADRVLLRLGSFPATDFGQLFDGVYALPWEEWLPADAAFPVKGRSVKSQLSSVPACQKIVKKAIVERLRKGHRVQSLAETGATYTVEVALAADEATLTLDTTGPGLNKRGYRTLVGEAQLKETLAAAMLMLCGWRPERPLVDPFCGTGTIPIEAALVGRNLAPGMHRTFAAENWPAVPERLWREARDEAQSLARPGLPQVIVASDIDTAALGQARFHARQAGVEADIHFQPRDFADLSSSKRHGLVLCNPPYGERLASRREVELLYRTMPAVFSRLATWSFGVLTSHSRFERLVGRKADNRRKLYNGQIECWFYQYAGPRPEEGTATPVFHDPDLKSLDRYRRKQAPDRIVESERESERSKSSTEFEMFANRLANRARHLRKWPARGITCFRIYERDIPEIPLVIDRYEDSLHIVERPRPHDRTLSEHHRWLAALAATAPKTHGVEPQRVFLKRYSDRPKLLAESSQVAPRSRSELTTALEAGLKFHVNLVDYLDTGLRLDLRTLRAMIRRLVAGKRLLSLFGNTGGFAVAAAAGSAVSSVTVDPLGVHVQWARENLLLNGFDSETHGVVQASPLDYLDELMRSPSVAAYDIVTIEDAPPPQMPLLLALWRHMAHDGVVFFITSDRRFKGEWDELADVQVREITRQTLPEDFRDRRVHRAWRLVRKPPESVGGARLA